MVFGAGPWITDRDAIIWVKAYDKSEKPLTKSRLTSSTKRHSGGFEKLFQIIF